MGGAPPPSFPAPNQTYRVYPFFQGYTSDCSAATIYLLPPSYAYGQAASVQLPFLYVGGADYQTAGYSNADFAMSFTLPQGTPTPPVDQSHVLANVTAQPAIWSCAGSARASLMARFADFLEGVEALEGTVVIHGASRRIASVIADAIPAPPMETLFYRYGLSPGLVPGTLPYVDVLPGMRLRVQAQASQFVAPASTENGYVPAGELVMRVCSTPSATDPTQRVIAFDPFLAGIREPLVQGTSTTPTVAGGVVDLAPAGGDQVHWRLFVPQQVPAANAVADLTVADNFTLVGAPTFSALAAATASYPNPPASGPAPLYVVFIGRAVIVPEIPIWMFSGTGATTPVLEHVPVGTTLTNVMERYMPLPLDPSQWTNLVTLNRPTSVSPNGQAPLDIFTTGLQALTPGLFDVPLIAGDSVTLKQV